MSEPKKHHYLSQFYLAGFSDNFEKDGKLYCYDLRDKKLRASKPRNEGYEKYFNRLESHNDPNEFEKTLAQCEDTISNSFRYIVKNKSLPKGEQFQELIYYISMLGVRNPYIRKSFARFQKDISRKALLFSFKDKREWERFKSEMNKEHNNKFANITYEGMMDFIKSDDWRLVEANENKVSREIEALNSVYQFSMERKWSLLIIGNPEHYFITSDTPVKLIWNIKNDYNFGPTFGERKSELIFPINKEILVWGSFERPSIINKNISKEEIGFLNSIQLLYYKRHLYSPTEKFILNKNEEILSSEILLK